MAHAFNLKFVRDRVKQLYSTQKNDPCIMIYEGRVNSAEAINPLDNWMDISEAQAMERLKYVEENYSGLFTFFLRNKKGEAHANSQKIVVQIGEAEAYSGRGGSAGVGNTQAQIQKAIADALTTWKLEMKVAELEKKLAKKQKSDAPWDQMGMAAFNKFVLNTSPAVAINGASQQRQIQEAPVNGAQDEPEASQALNDSFNLILETLGEEDVHKLALLTQDANTVAQFKMYLKTI